jgi:OOP family OmpA-OmpF porin
MILIVAAFTVLAAQSRAQNKYEFDGNRLKVEKPISFVPGTDQLEPASDEALKFVKDYLTDKKYISTLRIESHLRAGTANAQALSEKRALAIAKWLIKNGIDCKRLIAVGFGSTKPVSDPGSMPENTRIEFQNAALAGHAIGGMPLDGGGKSAGDICPSP